MPGYELQTKRKAAVGSHYKDEQSFGKAVKDGADCRVYLLYGGEAYLIEKWAKTLMGSDADGPFNSQRLDGNNPDIRDIWDTLEALPLFAQQKRVLLDDLDVAKFSGDDMQAFCELLGDIPPSSTLVITAKSSSFAESAAGKKLIKLAEQHGAAVGLSVRGQGDLVKFLQAQAKKLGCQLSAQSARHLLGICPPDMLLLENELRKVCAYAGEGEVSTQHIDAMVTPKTEARAFDLQRQILQGNTRGALELLAGLFYLREDPIVILGALSMSFCDLYRARAARDAGQNTAFMLKNYDCKSEFRARKAFENSGRVTTENARRAVGMLCESDSAMKSTGVDNKVYLEQLAVRLIAVCGRGG